MKNTTPQLNNKMASTVVCVSTLCLLLAGGLGATEQTSNYVTADELPPIYTGLYRIQVGRHAERQLFQDDSAQPDVEGRTGR